MIKTKPFSDWQIKPIHSSNEMHFLHITRCWPSRGPYLQTRNPRIWAAVITPAPGLWPAPALGSRDWRILETGARDTRQIIQSQTTDTARCSLELLGHDTGELWRIVMWRESLTWAELVSGHVTILNHDQTRGGGGCVTGLTRVSNLSHLSSNPYTRSTGELSRILTAPRQSDTDPGPVRLQPVSSTRLGPGLQLKSSLATTEDRLWNHLNICINYLSTKTINVIRLADFVTISGMPGATSGLILFWDCELHEVQLSLESPGEWEVWEQTLNTAGRGQATLQTVSGQAGPVCRSRQLSGNRSSRFRAETGLPCSVRGPLVLISTEIADTRGATSYRSLRRHGPGRVRCLSQIWLNKLISFAHLGLLKEFPDDILGR